ncbi:unnamed protein product [Effrenium voratum]|nr:unnamed protein product [Effrenium voratum]
MALRRRAALLVLSAGAVCTFALPPLPSTCSGHTLASWCPAPEVALDANSIWPWLALALTAGVFLRPGTRGTRGVPAGVPAGPQPLELLQNLRSAFQQQTWLKKHGEIFETWTPFFKVVCVSDPDLTRYIAVSKGNNYRKPCAYGRDPQLSQKIEEALGPGSSFPSFEEWRWRKFSLQGELSFQRQMALVPFLRILGHEMCDTLGAAADAGEAVRMNDIFSQATADAVLFLLFGRRLDFNSKHLERSTEELMEVLEGLVLPQLPGRREELLAQRGRAHEVMDRFLRPELEALWAEAQSGQRAPDRDPALLEALLRKEPRWREIGLENLLAEVRNFVNAGYEIQAFALSFALGFLAEPDNRLAARKARQSAVAIMEGGNQESFLQQTQHMQDLFNEALRLLPPTPSLTGVAYEDFAVQKADRSYFIGKGTTLNFQVLAGQRDPEHFGPCPDSFDPERWQGIKQSKLMTYNFGAHSCPGRDVSSLQARVWLPMLLAKFQFELEGRLEADTTGLHLKPKDGLRLRVVRLSEVMANHCYGRIAKSILPFLMAIHIGSRPIWLARAGPSDKGDGGQSGSDRNSSLSQEGHHFAELLAEFVQKRAARYWKESEKPQEIGCGDPKATG